jgi:ABC-type uncharacterized transport system permease subunit
MLPLLFSIATLIMYICASSLLFFLLVKQRTLQHNIFLLFTAGAIIVHGISLYHLIILPENINLAIDRAFSLVMFSVNTIVILSSLRKPLHSLFILLLPLSSIAVLVSIFHTSDNTTFNHLSAGIGLHVLLSIIAYSLLSMVVLQALLLYWQDSHLKKHQLSSFIKHLPPLQTMEALMFELLWVGVILLASGIIIGALYIDDMFAQHLAHKTFLSILAWFIFATLLFGRVKWGWRGNQAIRWVLVGFCVLMLGYFGSKLVLEVFLV